MEAFWKAHYDYAAGQTARNRLEHRAAFVPQCVHVVACPLRTILKDAASATDRLCPSSHQDRVPSGVMNETRLRAPWRLYSQASRLLAQPHNSDLAAAVAQRYDNSLRHGAMPRWAWTHGTKPAPPCKEAQGGTMCESELQTTTWRACTSPSAGFSRYIYMQHAAGDATAAWRRPARGVHPNTNQAANMAETMTDLSECDNLTDIAPKRMPCSHFNNESTQCQKHRVGKSPCVHAHGLCRRAAVPSCMPSLVQQIRPSSPQFDGTPSAHLYLWLNFTSTRDLCEASNAFRHISAAIQHASHSTLRRWYPMRAASTSRVKPRMQLAAGPPVTSTIAALASRLLSPPAMLLGRFGNVEMLSAMRIADGGHPPSWLRDYAGFYSGTSNTSSRATELAFQRAYVRAARASDKVMLVVEQSAETAGFACRFGLPLTAFVRAYELDELLELMHELAKLRARVLLVTGFPSSMHRQLARLPLIHPSLPHLSQLQYRILGTPLDGFESPERRQHSDWAKALDALMSSPEWNSSRSDVALLGCGAFGMPLAAHARSKGLSAMYIGGRLPTLFGIVGRYDRTLPQVRRRMNAHWISPLPEETPTMARGSNLENHGYWGGG